MKKLFISIGLVLLLFSGTICQAKDTAYKSVTSVIKYQYIGDYSIDRLNKILTTELSQFSDFSIEYPPAENAVKLYKVIYNTVIPEKNNKPVTVSGLIAIPEIKASTYPVVSYQHGTVFSRNEVPSSPEDSPETRIMISRFAGHGYIVIAADYVGKGVSDEPDGWMVKDVTAQACYDMLSASNSVLSDLNISSGDLFLSGWSQGSFSTLAFLKKLERSGVAVKAASMESSPNDIYLCFNRWINVPSDLDVQWLVGTASMLVNAYENYYDMPGLSKIAIKPEYWQTAHDFYNNKISWTQAAKVFPQKSKDLFQEEFIQDGSLVTTRFFEQLQLNNSYNWRFKTPCHFYYGKIDEVVTPYMVNLPVEYEKTLGGAQVEGVYAGDKADHRGTFLFGVLDQKKWFDKLK